jgi:hypothetical protein
VRSDGISLAGPSQKVAEVVVDDAVLAELAMSYDDEMALAHDNVDQNSVVRGP